MASTSEEERLKAEIAKLSGAIQTHKQQQHYGSGYAPRGRGGGGYSTYRGAFAGRARGRGAAAIPLRNRTLILNDAATKMAPQGSSTASASASADKTSNADDTASTPSSNTADGWVKRKSTHNMSLVSTSTFQRTEPARLAALEATRKAKAEAKAKAASSSTSSSKTRKPAAKQAVRRGDNMGEVVIDGVVFEFDPSGTKLVKKLIQPSSSTSDTASTTATWKSGETAVPLKTSINGQDYIRTKRGNLISAELLAKRKAQREAQAKMSRLDRMVGQISAMQATRNASSRVSRTLDVKKAKTLCTFFNKTGQCKRGLSCPYLHDSSKIALCPKVLRPGGCQLAKGTCPLSHTPRAERVPHCVHYLRSGQCRNGDQCVYTHADLAEDAKICRDFSDYGWCDRGRQCEERHTYECPDFIERGKCARKACKLVHVIRATEEKSEGGEGWQDGELFLRDDAAAAEEAQEEGGKRKRPLMETVLPEEEDEEELVDFTNGDESRGAKRRKAKAFTQQKDFISFDEEEEGSEDDDEDEEEEEEEEEEENEEENEEQEGEEEDDVGSVHSEDFELSDGEEDGDEPSAAQPAHGDDDDDDLVDRDL